MSIVSPRAALPLVIFAFSTVRCGRETIAHQQNEKAANTISVLLDQEGGIECDKVEAKGSNPPAYDVSVSKRNAQAALTILERHNLPASKHKDTCAMIDGGDLIPTAERERAKTICGISGDITNKLRSISGVIDASALVSIPARELTELDPSEPRAHPKASVIISFLPNKTGSPPIELEEVQRFAAAGVPELAPKDVFVRMVEVPQDLSPKNAPTCVKTEVLGVLICAEHRGRLSGLLLSAVCASGFFAAIMLIAILRALRYRRELTKLSSVHP